MAHRQGGKLEPPARLVKKELPPTTSASARLRTSVANRIVLNDPGTKNAYPRRAAF